ncbi:DNase I-like protein, partial [Peniophora sp. CONT]
MPTQPHPPSFHILSFNANHTPTNTKYILETNKDCDIIFVQEPYYGTIKHVPSPHDPHGKELFGTQSAPDWFLLEVEDVRNSRVATYVNKRWKGAHPMRRIDIINHPHVLCVSLRFGDTDKLFLNVYGHPDSRSGIHALAELPARTFTCVAGDFNLHHSRWESTKPTQELASTLCERMLGLGVDLLNPVDVHTHFPHNAALAPSVVDLAWVNADFFNSPHCSLSINQNDRGTSDHAILTIEIPTRPAYIADPVIKKGSEDELSFFRTLTSQLEMFATADLSNSQSIDTVVDGFFATMDGEFNRLARIPDISSHAKDWWVPSCDDAFAAFREDRTPANRKATRTAVRTAQRTHFDAQIDKAVENNQPWDLTSWYKDRRLQTTTAI